MKFYDHFEQFWLINVNCQQSVSNGCVRQANINRRTKVRHKSQSAHKSVLRQQCLDTEVALSWNFLFFQCFWRKTQTDVRGVRTFSICSITAATNLFYHYGLSLLLHETFSIRCENHESAGLERYIWSNIEPLLFQGYEHHTWTWSPSTPRNSPYKSRKRQKRAIKQSSSLKKDFQRRQCFFQFRMASPWKEESPFNWTDLNAVYRWLKLMH